MDIDVDPFDERGKTDEATGGEEETIPLIPRGTQIDPYGNESGGEQETSYIKKSQAQTLKEGKVISLYNIIIEKIGKRPDALHFDFFDLRRNTLYYIDVNGEEKLLTRMGNLKTFAGIKREIGPTGIRRIGFYDYKEEKKLSSKKSERLRKTERELPSTSDITKADEIELKEITDKSITSMNELIQEISSDRGTQTGEDDPDMPTMRELVGLDKEFRSIRGSLKVEAAKKVEIEQKLKKENRKLEEFREYPGVYDDAMKEDITKRIERLNDDLKVREESIDLLKGRLKNQITSFRETIAKVMDKDATLGERIRTLFREQGITIFSILTAIGMAIGVLVEAVLPGSTATTTVGDSHGGGGDDDKPKSAKEWIRNKLRALASLLGKLAEKAGAALPGIIGSVVAWLLNRAKEVVGWISKNLWSLVLLCVWMVYDYMKKPQSVSKKK